jgi:polyisoprenoid-binding protein YceI
LPTEGFQCRLPREVEFVFQLGVSAMTMSGMLAAALFALVAGAAQATPELYTIEPLHTYPSFELSHQGISYWRGKFNKTSGKVWLDRDKQTGRVEISIDTSSVNFGLAMMDQRARGEEWFDVEKYPTARYVSESITFSGGVPVSVNGQLTLRGITQPVKLDVVEFKCIEHRLFKREVCGADVRAEFDRRQFGMVNDIINDNGKVRLQIQVEAIKGDMIPMPPGMPPGAPPGNAPPK